MQEYLRKAVMVRPSGRQLLWQQLEFYAFIHFTVNTFTDREWGLGDENPSVFDPSALDADQWVEVCKAAGMKALILTCKHHDGFCLWPSKYTAHTVKNSPWRNGGGDVVREVSEACRKAGLKFGIYLSPWDRHEKTYGDLGKYNTFFANQLRELLTGYGDIFSVWFDGACGEGPNGKRQVYDWNRWYGVIRELQPDAVISVCGPDVRWCGNEAGYCRESEWSVVPAALRDAEKTAEKSQQQDDREFSRRVNSADEDLGSRKVLKNAGELVWYPAEVNTSIRPGWFWHESEDGLVKPAEELFDVYCKAVGGNANFLLNIPPDRRGLIHDNDVACLRKLGKLIGDSFSGDLAKDAVFTPTGLVFTGKGASYTSEENDGRGREVFEASLEVDLKEEKTFDRAVIMEDIRTAGQVVESFCLEVMAEGNWKTIYKGTVVGYKKICLFDRVQARYIRLKILEARWHPGILHFGAYYLQQRI